MLILLGNGSRVSTGFKPVELGLGLTFVLKKKKKKGKVVFLVIRIGETLLQEQIISDSLFCCSHQVQFRLDSPRYVVGPPSETMGPVTGCKAFRVL